MTIKGLTILNLGLLFISIILIGMLFLWAINEIYSLINTSVKGSELISSLRKMQAQTNKLLITDNLDISYQRWLDTSIEFQNTIIAIKNSSRINTLLQNEEFQNKYNAFNILCERALDSIVIIKQGYTNLINSDKYENIGLFLYYDMDETVLKIAYRFREIGDYFSANFENTIIPFITLLEEESMQLQMKIIVVFFILTACILTVTVVLIIIIRRKEEIRNRQMFEIEAQMNKLESLGFFAGGVAHDFNNYLSAIIGNVSIAKTYVDKESELFEILDDAEKSSVQAIGLTKQFFAFSKGNSPVIELKRIQGIIKGTVNFVLRGSRITCKYFLPEELWNVEIDEIKICEVINNLVINSKQAMPEGGEIVITGENVVLKKRNKMHIKQGKYVHISIKDSGSGIPENLKSKVINPFFTTKKKGSGLGLAISYSIIHKHKGSIHFTSKENEGTTFHIYLKASTKSINSEEVLKEEKIELEGRILLMDDEKEIRKTGIRMLSRLGFKPVAVRNGEEALAEYKKSIDENNPFKAVILDITIQGGMGGKQTIIELLKINPDIKAIVSSGYSEQKVINEYLKYGFKGFLKKAYTLTDLRNILIKIISD